MTTIRMYRARVLAPALCTLVAAGCGDDPMFTSLEDTLPFATRDLAFTSDRNGNTDVWAVDADGDHLVRLTAHTYADEDPAWSPDGTALAFASERTFYNVQIYVDDADGIRPLGITDPWTNSESPSWSPDGARIAFTGSVSKDWWPEPEIQIMDVDGGNIVNLTARGAPTGTSPAWSPDGSRIAFTSDGDVWVVNVDGSDPVRLTEDPGSDISPAWAPDGRRIAFASDRDGDFEIYVMNADGSDPVRLTESAGDDRDPAWSRDGSKIAFTSLRDGDSEIYVMDTDGSGPVNVTRHPANDYAPSWSR